VKSGDYAAVDERGVHSEVSSLLTKMRPRRGPLVPRPDSSPPTEPGGSCDASYWPGGSRSANSSGTRRRPVKPHEKKPLMASASEPLALV
jgi:hypothetical protein